LPAYQFKVGAIEAIVIQDGNAPVDKLNLPQRYPNATEEEMQAAYQYLEDANVPSEQNMNLLLLNVNGSRILVDTGMSMRSQNPAFGKLMFTLAELNIAPQKIDIVYITHFHGDHISGLLDEEMQPAFPNAKIITPQVEWDAWMNPEKIAEEGETAKRWTSIVEPLKDRFSFVDYGDEIAEGVRVVDIRGHSLGHSGLLIESQGEKLLHLVDMLHNPAQLIYPHWHIMFDADKELAVKTRREQLAYAADNKLLVMFYHLDFPALGHVRREGDSFRWQPIDY
jgi:glyoxylase-like metal-dependent hydrolase (beta-lactamase superfamily II)